MLFLLQKSRNIFCSVLSCSLFNKLTLLTSMKPITLSSLITIKSGNPFFVTLTLGKFALTNCLNFSSAQLFIIYNECPPIFFRSCEDVDINHFMLINPFGQLFVLCKHIVDTVRKVVQ